jgi:hypothetical protein
MQLPGAVRSARILVINPNSSRAVTAAIDAALDPLRLAGGPAIAVTDLPEGPASIGSQQDADSVVMPLARRIAADGADAFVIACFSDPGLHTAREVAEGRPVMGIVGPPPVAHPGRALRDHRPVGGQRAAPAPDGPPDGPRRALRRQPAGGGAGG